MPDTDQEMGFAYGRLYAPDSRDRPMAAVLEEEAPWPEPWRYHYDNGWWGDQLDTPRCVAFGVAHLLEDHPVPRPGIPPILHPDVIYPRAQELDEFPPGTDGTSVRAGLKVAKEHGLIESYHRAATIDEVIEAILRKAPVIAGLPWLPSMNRTDPDGIILIQGSVTSSTPGHCIVVNGVNKISDTGRVKNSWNRQRWGRNGRGTMRLHGAYGLEMLMDHDGDVWVVKEQKRVAV